MQIDPTVLTKIYKEMYGNPDSLPEHSISLVIFTFFKKIAVSQSKVKTNLINTKFGDYADQ